MRKFLLVGIGNQIRGDDGIGPYCINRLAEKLSEAEKKLVDCMIVHQLDVTQCKDFTEYDLVVFIDADAREGTAAFTLEQVKPGQGSQSFTSHIGSLSDILSLAQGLYGTAPAAYLVGIRGDSFEIGEELSLRARANAEEAIRAVRGLINQLLPFG